MRFERERACDDAVLAAGTTDIDYAELLFAVATQGHPASVVGMAHAGDLAARIRAILEPATARHSSRRVLASVATGVLLATAGLGGLDVFGSTSAIARVDEPFRERIVLAPGREAFAVHRSFSPRDGREAYAFEALQSAAMHVPQHEMDFIRDRGVWALSIARDDEVVEPLLRQLASSDWRARANAAWCLDLIGVHEAREGLVALLHDPVWRVRAMAATALVGLGGDRPPEDVLQLLDDPAWQVRAPAVELASRLRTDEADARIRLHLNDSHPAVRHAAEAALAEATTP
jgi:hypothetical protein